MSMVNTTINATLDTAVAATPVIAERIYEFGFESVFAIAGLLGVAYLVLRQKE